MPLVELEPRGAVALIRMNRSPMNAINAEVTADLDVAVRGAADAAYRAVVVHGTPNFCAGADIEDFIAAHRAGATSGIARDLQRVLRRLEQLAKPVLAAVHGYALGGGCELALACDFRVLADTARIGQPAILLGLIPGAGGTQRLAQLIGIARAKELIYTGRFAKADEALRVGLADQVVPEAEVLDTALASAARYAAGPTVALGAARRAIHGSFELDRDAGLDLEWDEFQRVFDTEDARAGCASFKENGPGKATFTGR